jgi:hypothetical protein
MSATSSTLITAISSVAVGVLAASSALLGSSVQRKADRRKQRREVRREVYGMFMDKFDAADKWFDSMWSAKLPVTEIDETPELVELTSALNRVELEGPDSVVEAGMETFEVLLSEYEIIYRYAMRSRDDSGRSSSSLKVMAGQEGIDIRLKRGGAVKPFISAAKKALDSDK